MSLKFIENCSLHSVGHFTGELEATNRNREFKACVLHSVKQKKNKEEEVVEKGRQMENKSFLFEILKRIRENQFE